MKLLLLPDVLLMALGLPAVSPRLSKALLRRRSVCRSALNHAMRTAMTLLFCLGLGGCMLIEPDQAPRSENEDNIRKDMLAPDFCLPSLDEDRTVRLSDFRGHKPVVLIFGNFY